MLMLTSDFKTSNYSELNVCRMGSALLSRFDLVFILLDKPDEVLLQST